MGIILRAGQTIRATPEGGLARRYINKTGSISVRGTLLELSGTVPFAVNIVGADEPHPMGVMEEDNIPDGAECWVVYSGPAYILLEDGTSTAPNYWAKVSANVAGRCDASNPLPPGGTVQALEGHMKEVGHSMETVTSGTNKLALIHTHFN